ncbi:hypothetical protein D3OALGA1CA_2699 [Olavius algarvensis associated proteobacterium Delta 3]|nr:hypothetical protein D3OALGB2SA_2657 [Olavius algarvensis associated proteobacterium Delta 3]CAB5123006.1 hypothetical protein D3OALGA1CA_2699 [Olavius algarvensis associated proteobacterium Delta 3]
MKSQVIQTSAFNVFCSPRSKISLHVNGSHLVSADGVETFPIHDGIPCFLRYKSCVEANGEDELIELNRVAAKRGWRESVDQIYGRGSPMSRYVCTSTRANFLDLLSLGASSTVLELGIGFGQITVALAQRAQRVHALEVRHQQALFARRRCTEEGLTNVTFACGGDDCRLPYHERAIDVVILNLVFEWCSSRNLEEPGEIGQRILLKEVFRVLKPGGTLFLATKNRFALRLLLGKRDEHAFAMRFGHALPGWLMRTVLRIKGHEHTTGRIHSYSHLGQMLRQVGFADLSSFWAAPEMRYPMQYIPTDAYSIREARREPNLVQGASRSTRAVMR